MINGESASAGEMMGHSMLRLWTTIEEKMDRIATHPGEVLREECLVPLGMSARQLAEAIGVPGNRVSDLARERRGITADTAIRLGKYFGTSAQFWLNLQTAYDLSVAEVTQDYSSIKPRAA